MTRICVRATIDAPRGAVWTRLADNADHVEWMADARAIRFTSERRAPVAGLVAASVLRLVWRGNLRRLASLVENRAHG
jgi:hypothetical protein